MDEWTGEDVWEVWRTDDHGNDFLMRVVETQEEARRIVETFTARGHKQTYMYVRRGASDEGCGKK
ncbi:MAG: hypothetical protein AAGI01_01210 [Myxococcota bacterium]